VRVIHKPDGWKTWERPTRRELANRAKRLECVRFIGAFGRAETSEMWMIFGWEKAALKRTQSKRWRDFFVPWLFVVVSK
jgi:hypothetical protein